MNARVETPVHACIEMLRDPDIVTNWNHSDGYPIATLASDPMLFHSTEEMLMVSLTDVRTWRRACDALAVEFDAVVGIHLGTILGANPARTNAGVPFASRSAVWGGSVLWKFQFLG